MKTLKYVAVVSTVVVFAVVVGCAPKHTVILVPDPDGHVGKASIMTEAGQQHLEKPGDMTRVTTKSSAPSAVKTADSTFISVTFADALAAEPIPPEKFILYFKTGKTELTAESEATLPNILASIKKRGAINIAVSGHTDTVGSDQFNETLSRHRAESIRDLLIRGGVPGDLITVTSHGKGNPLIPVPDGVAEPRNRRVEITVH